MKIIGITLFMISLSLPAQADTEIILSDTAGRISTVSTNGKAARMQQKHEPGYLLMNLQDGSIHSVDTQRREVMQLSDLQDMPATMPAMPTPGIRVRLVDQGKGPTIAGYATRKYRIDVNGKNCGTIMGSKAVLKLQGVAKIFSVFSNLQKQSRRMAGGFRGLLNECQSADLQLSEHYQTTGAPMRVLDENGLVESEVMRINTQASKPTGYYQAPADYRVTDMQQQMQRAQQQQREMKQQMQNNMPDMNRLMERMQSQPGMPPEALEQMQKMQEMFKQQAQ